MQLSLLASIMDRLKFGTNMAWLGLKTDFSYEKPHIS